jgi:glycosyltransferase involved in cell wall biosynthesis
MRLLFAKNSLVWPRSSGHDVHTFHMMKACAELGHEVSLATVVEPTAEAVAGLPLKAWFPLDDPLDNGTDQTMVIRKTALQERFRSFYGVPESQLVALARAVHSCSAEAVIVAGLDALPYFSPLPSRTIRVWYAADEWIWHHVSQIRLGYGELRLNLRDAVVKGLYERAHRRLVDRVWVVSQTERRAMRWLAGMREADVLPNGVDGVYFQPDANVTVEPRTAVFWGRLDFGPNIQALEWFGRRVWPLVRARVPDAQFTIIGFKPSDAVRRLASADGNGISLKADLEDLRDTARRHAVAVLPFVSGGGIKNKLLEAAALGLPIVCTPTAMAGLRAVQRSHLVVTSTPEQMSRAMVDLWADADRRRRIGAATREWVLEHHTWTATAREAVTALEQATKVARSQGHRVRRSQRVTG